MTDRQIPNRESRLTVLEEGAELAVAEMRAVIDHCSQALPHNYGRVRFAYQNPYSVPDLDPLRHEGCLCLMFGLNQSAITLTNHMLEKLLKTALIHQYSLQQEDHDNPPDPPSADAMADYLAEGKAMYANNDLSTNINAACSRGLVTKEEKRELHEIRDRLRNAFGHADPDKTFGDSEVDVQALRFSDDGRVILGAKESPKVADFLIPAGIIQVQIANQIGPEYFLYVDGLARRIFDKLYPVHMDEVRRQVLLTALVRTPVYLWRYIKLSWQVAVCQWSTRSQGVKRESSVENHDQR